MSAFLLTQSEGELSKEKLIKLHCKHISLIVVEMLTDVEYICKQSEDLRILLGDLAYD